MFCFSSLITCVSSTHLVLSFELDTTIDFKQFRSSLRFFDILFSSENKRIDTTKMTTSGIVQWKIPNALKMES